MKEATVKSKNLQQECPLGEIIYKLSDREDYCSSDVDCPPMGRCNLHTHLCCGPPGECPVAGEHPVFDEQGEKLLDERTWSNMENVNNNNL
ncbi:unnamed protein product [Meloidogyne enterolobii]|uniref:Uncharacterized protein n=1 Tax=Meloidogyne enterolobii TaxID=390850 RepID=A0ACB0YYN9_MELEN